MSPLVAAHATASAAELYGRVLESSDTLLLAHDAEGRSWPLPLAAWLGPLTAADEDVLDRVIAPVLDVGCGPGRHVLALARRGQLALGVDVSPAAVRVARSRGAAAIEACVFADVPGAGAWGSALLLDGNIGIGGRPAALLARVASLLAPRGRIIVELAAPGAASGAQRVRLESDGRVSGWFDWATLAPNRLPATAAAVGLDIDERWEVEDRWFACLVAS
jgi:SAM-dependent methyltransferase